MSGERVDINRNMRVRESEEGEKGNINERTVVFNKRRDGVVWGPSLKMLTGYYHKNKQTNYRLV